MALAGEAYMKEIDMEKVKEIEKELSKLAKTISEEWKLRHVQSPLEKAASAVLGKEAVEDRLEEDTTGDDPVTRGHRQMLRKLEGLIKLLPQYQQDKFDAVEMLLVRVHVRPASLSRVRPPERGLFCVVQEAGQEGELSRV